MSAKSWAAIAKPPVVEETPSEPAAIQSKGPYVFVPRPRKLTTGTTRMARATPAKTEDAPLKPIKPPMFISPPFPSDWYRTALEMLGGLPALDDDVYEEPHWHYIFRYAEMHLFTEEFNNPHVAYDAGVKGIRDLEVVMAMIEGLSTPDRQRAKAALELHQSGKTCRNCTAAPWKP